MPPETPLANDPSARTETGVIKDTATPTPPPTPTPTPEPKPTPTPEAKADGTPSDKPSLANEKPAPGAPEKYSDFKVPEGFELDKEALDKASPMFKELGLSQENAQKLVDFYTEASKQAMDAPFKLWQETQEKWISEVRTDPEIGSKLDSVRTTIARAIDGVGDPKLAADFRQAMDYTGAGNNLAFIKTFWKLAQQLTEGGHVAGNAPSPESQKRPGEGPPSVARALYPNLP